jgi:2-polyprenyl-3-methyl-5-hydroxy-6-metoxy-1,4-benzoquinol methylase
MTNVCLVCNSKDIINITKKTKFISSDLEPINSKVSFFFCNLCANLQKEINKNYINKIKEIYKNYIGFKKYNNKDQTKTFDIESSKNRCDVIYDLIESKFKRKKIKFLDFGCSNGAMLYPMVGEKNILMYGTDIKNILDKKIAKAINFSKFIDLNKISSHKNTFDIITLIHVFEHFTNPKTELMKISELLKKNGRIYIQIPNYNENYYDFHIYDHVTHWNSLSLYQIFSRTGLEIERIYTSVIDCEYTIILKKKKTKIIKIDIKKINQEKYKILNRFEKLDKLMKKLTNIQEFSILGSSVAASLIVSHFKNKIKYIYDQDLNKIGDYHFNFLIHRLKKNENKKIFLPFPEKRLSKIKKNLKNYNFKFIN